MSDNLISDQVITDQTAAQADGNHLFPVFLKLENLSLLVVGGGYVALEKLTAILNNSPETVVRVVATSISHEVKLLAASHPNIQLVERPYESSDIDSADLVIAAVNDRFVSEQLSQDAKDKSK